MCVCVERGGGSDIGRSLIGICLSRELLFLYTTPRPYYWLNDGVQLGLIKRALLECILEQAFLRGRPKC